ncbi:recombinase family protein [Ferrimonas sediminicola]|uniref:Recombinase family protein n=1 Tax=Ferrimonas sediminicola TaxID=2569538 RepID=A0A4U1B886_9GAMM|nr:recombinase family protein [Ferrimonas sediminicola]TKB46779.1 recombinase family protein [Ferrimonas sediminicola]
MGRIFAYCRVSTAEQTAENQSQQLLKQIPGLKRSRIVSETISGGTNALQRPEFLRLLERLEDGDELVVLKVDRLGRDVSDVLSTIKHLQSKGVAVRSLDLPISNLSGPEGKLILTLMSAFAEFEKARLIERTQDGLTRAKLSGKRLGRPIATNTRLSVQKAKGRGLSQSQVMAELALSRSTVKRYWKIDR